MNIYTKYVVTCEKVKPTLVEKLLRRTKEKVEIRAPYVLNGFRDKINVSVLKILTIEPTDEKMEMYGNSQKAYLSTEFRTVKL